MDSTADLINVILRILNDIFGRRIADLVPCDGDERSDENHSGKHHTSK